MNDCHRCIGRTNPLSTFYHLNRHHRDPDAIASEAKQSPQHLLPLNGRHCDPDASGEAILMNDCHRCIGRTNPLSTFYHLNRHHRDPDAIASEAKQSSQHLLPLNGRHCDPDASGEAILMNDCHRCIGRTNPLSTFYHLTAIIATPMQLRAKRSNPLSTFYH